ncbi:response regulator [Spirochaeta dissipatitropha]
MEHLLRGKQILVVDDNPDNLLLLERVLDKHGFSVRTAGDGTIALEEVNKEYPDLILLDLQMPGIDGFEVCRILKEDEKTAVIPVLIMSAADRIENITRGFELGAVDFISKPFHNLEVLARVRTHLMTQAANTELLHMARQKSLEYLVMGIAHEVNTPLGNAITALSIAAEERRHVESIPMNADFASSINRINEAHGILEKSLTSIKSLVQSLNQIHPDTIVEAEQKIRVLDIIELVLSSTGHALEELSCRVEVMIDEDLSLGEQHRFFLQIITNLVVNVIDHAFPDDIPVDQRSMGIECSKSSGSLLLRVSDTGCGIPEEISDNLFDPFVTTKRGQKKTGLGLYIVANAAASVKGSVSWENNAGKGTVFTVGFPLS